MPSVGVASSAACLSELDMALVLKVKTGTVRHVIGNVKQISAWELLHNAWNTTWMNRTLGTWDGTKGESKWTCQYIA